MAENTRTQRTVSEKESMSVAEAARQKEWKEPSFLREMFLGHFRLGLIRPLPDAVKERPEFTAYYARFKKFLEEHVDPVGLDADGVYPPEMLDGLKRMGAFGMKIPTEYGGLGFDQVEYGLMMELLGSYDGSLCALLSAHQSIGVPQPIKIFGTKEQKAKFLPRCAAGAISAFALTEEGVGSDPARLATTVEPASMPYLVSSCTVLSVDPVSTTIRMSAPAVALAQRATCLDSLRAMA
jgi:alkylation response protein AidB-like acyl-CoA dehydrogenase